MNSKGDGSISCPGEFHVEERKAGSVMTETCGSRCCLSFAMAVLALVNDGDSAILLLKTIMHPTVRVLSY